MAGMKRKKSVQGLDLTLPELKDSPWIHQGLGNAFHVVSMPELIGAMQHGATVDAVRKYLSRPADQEVRDHINALICGVPAMFFVVSTCNKDMIRLWVKYGGDVNAVHQLSGLPLLTFAILQQGVIERSTTHVVATLLSLGAMPQAIPSLFWTPYDRDLPLDPYQWRESELDKASQRWCTATSRLKLAGLSNLTHRYNLCRASTIRPRLRRERQVANLRKSERVFEIPYFLIGQTAAVELLTQELLCHITFDEKKPLVLVFAGPSGHGKTELARSLGDVLSLEIEVVDCTGHRHDTDLFGAKAPYEGWKKGSPLNNFLARKGNARQNGVVFLDEFEKMDPEIYSSLLFPLALGAFSSVTSSAILEVTNKSPGEYTDRRTSTMVNCPGMIFILATNALDDIISAFCRRNYDALFVKEDQVEMMHLVGELKGQLKQVFLSRFGVRYISPR